MKNYEDFWRKLKNEELWGLMDENIGEFWRIFEEWRTLKIFEENWRIKNFED